MKKYTKILSGAMALTLLLTGCGTKSDEHKEDNHTAVETTAGNHEIEGETGNEKTDNTNYTTQASIQNNYDASSNCESETAISNDYNYNCDYDYDYVIDNEYEYSGWMDAEKSPVSTFAADVDTASYSYVRNCINNSYYLDTDTVRIEEMINYFHYDYEMPKAGEKFAVNTEYADCPWNEGNKLAMINMATGPIDFSDAPASNIVFLIDTSGSMFGEDRLSLIQNSLIMLAENFTEKDRISIVTYAGSDTVVLSGTRGDNYYEITRAIENLEAGGSTNGSAGIVTAYEIAEENFIKGGNNRVILATDGDLNVGITSEKGLERLIMDEKKSGVFLSVIGVGYGNYNDANLETLADKGNGTYAYIDSIFEAKKTLVENLGASMMTVAKDVKLQCEFNPDMVESYRLIGYDDRMMAAEDFDDDSKDGGEMGAGHIVTALYEIVPAGRTTSRFKGMSDEDNLFTLDIRYKEPDGNKSKLVSYECNGSDYNKGGSDNLRWASAVAAFGMLIKYDEYREENIDGDFIIGLAESALDKTDDYKVEFIELVNKYSASDFDYGYDYDYDAYDY